MGKLAGRGYLVALAVPITMVIAPLAASAEATIDAVPVEHAESAAVPMDGGIDTVASTDKFSPGPDWYEVEDTDVANYDPDGNNTTVVVNGIHDGDVNGNIEDDSDAGPFWYHHGHGIMDTHPAAIGPVDVVDDEDEDVDVDVDNDVDVVDDNDVDYLDDEDVDVVEDDDADVVDDDSWSFDDVTATEYEDSTAAAGPEGAYVDSTESGSYSDNEGLDYAFGDDDATVAYYDETTAGAGSGGAFVNSVESGAGEIGGGYGDFGDDDATGAYYDAFTAQAGEYGAWTQSIESGAADLD
jgi:hypothetical protein